MKTFAIIPAGGKGTRTGSVLPKQYCEFHGKELIAYTLEVFENCDDIDEIHVAVEKEFFDLLNTIKDKYNITKLTGIVEGGRERQDSVYNVLSSLSAVDDDIIAVHDAARPLLPEEILSRAINTAKIFDNVVVAIQAKDSLIKGSGSVEDYIPRKGIYYAQTPQVFKFEILKTAMEKAYANDFTGTDESMLVKKAGYDVKIVEGSSINFKVTDKFDCDLFELISASL